MDTDGSQCFLFADFCPQVPTVGEWSFRGKGFVSSLISALVVAEVCERRFLECANFSAERVDVKKASNPFPLITIYYYVLFCSFYVLFLSNLKKRFSSSFFFAFFFSPLLAHLDKCKLFKRFNYDYT